MRVRCRLLAAPPGQVRRRSLTLRFNGSPAAALHEILPHLLPFPRLLSERLTGCRPLRCLLRARMDGGTTSGSPAPIPLRLPSGQHVRVRTTGQSGAVSDVPGGGRYLVALDDGDVAICTGAELEQPPNR